MEKLNVLDKKKVKELFMTGEIKSHTDVLELNKILFKELMESMLEAVFFARTNYPILQNKLPTFAT